MLNDGFRVVDWYFLYEWFCSKMLCEFECCCEVRYLLLLFLILKEYFLNVCIIKKKMKKKVQKMRKRLNNCI